MYDIGDIDLCDIDQYDTSGGLVNTAKYLLNLVATRDLQGTSSVRATIASVMQERNTLHFGHWQLDKKKRDPNYFGYRRGSTYMIRPFTNVFSDLIKFFSDDQVEGTLKKFYQNQKDLILLKVDTLKLDNLVWEQASDGTMFQHLYSQLDISNIVDEFDNTLANADTHVMQNIFT